MSRAKILIVEDELVIALSIRKSLEKLEYEVSGIVTTGEGAVEKALEQDPDLILMDIILSGAIDGIEAARMIRKKADIPIIYLTANADSSTVERAHDTLPYGYLNKPINERDLLTNVDSSIYKHRMERRISESEKKYRNLIENINDIIISFDENGTITYISPQTYDISGYRAEEVIGNNIVHYVHPDDRKKLIHVLEKSKTGVKETGEYRIISKTGDTLWMRISGRPNFIDDRFVGVRAILSDITKQKIAEETAKKQEQFLNAIFDSIQDGLSVLDSDYTILRVNETMNRWYGHMRPLEGKRCYEAYHLRGIHCEICPSRRAFQTGRLEVDIVPMTTSQGQTGWLELFSFPMLNVQGEVTGIVEYVRDITARKLAEEEVKRSNDELTAANEELQAIIEELEATSQDFEAQNKELLRTQADLAHREALLESIFRAAPTGVGIVRKRVIDWANKMFCSMTGYTEEELKGQSARMLYPTDEDFEYVGRDKYAQISKMGTGTVETRWKRKDGTVINILLSSTPLDMKNTDGGVVFTALDITEQKKAEQALGETIDKYRLLAANVPHNLWVIDVNTLRFIYSNPSIVNILGYDNEETLNKKIKDVMTPQSYDMVMKVLKEELERDVKPGVDPNRTITLELEQYHKNGSIVMTEVTVKALRDKTGKITAILGLSRDITEQKQLKRALADSEEKYRLITTNIPHTLWVVDINTLKFVYFNNPSLVSILGYDSKEGLNLHMKNVMTPKSYEMVMNVLREELARDGKPGVDPNRIVTMEEEQYHKNGSIRLVEVTAKFIRDKAGAITGILGISRDVTEQKRTQKALEESEKKFRMIIEDSPIPISLMDNESGAITYINKATTGILGYTLDDYSNMSEWENIVYPDPVNRKKMHDDWEKAFRKWDHRKGFKTYELDVRCKSGSFKRIEFQITPLGDQTVVIMNDLTERKIQQEMLIQTEKMMSLGGMAAGMAHEINNPLGIILQGIQGALSRLEPTIKKNRETAVRLGTDLDTVLAYLKEREILEYLNGIQDAGLRAAKIITNMLQFSRRSETNIAPVDINKVIDKTIEIAANDYDLKKKYDFKMIQIIREYDAKLPRVPCSETGIEQVVLNLLKNSSQAMSAIKTKGFRPTITIKTGMEDQYVYIKLTDNGPGIEKNIQQRIFEPFYTTKETGMGTGLGLSVSNHIIKKIHHGQISVESDAGKGATFTIKLPIKRSK